MIRIKAIPVDCIERPDTLMTDVTANNLEVWLNSQYRVGLTLVAITGNAAIFTEQAWEEEG